MIVQAFEDLIAIYNNEERCGFCWEFEAPYRISDMNESIKKSDDCCVRVFLINRRGNDNNFRPNVNNVQVSRITEIATLYFLIYDDIGTNVHKEIPDHPVSESKHERILKPLLNCILDLDFCEVNEDIVITSKSWSSEIDYLADNYTGWRVDINFNYFRK